MIDYWHSVILDKDLCCGCTNCLDRCPTQAIRVIEGKAKIINERCTDCGECIKVCPYHAKGALTDDLSILKNYKYNIALPAISLYGQFTLEYDMNRIFNGFLDLGFDDVFDTALAADVVSACQKEYLDNPGIAKPMISTYCPTIIRLIQIRYPSLIDNIIPIEAPMEVAARLAKRAAKEKTGLSDDEIGVFYITQCPAKITSIKSPIGISKSCVNGAISLKKIYSKLLKNYDNTVVTREIKSSSGFGVGWGRVGGQSYSLEISDYLAVDGIEEVIKILDQIELGKLDNIDFFEGYACVTGCSGGPLNVENPFVAKSRIRKLSYDFERLSDDMLKALYASAEIVFDQEIEALSILKLDSDFKKAMEKMAKIEEISKILPQIDCGACGSPTCKSLAEDIVMGRAKIDDCIVRRDKQ